MKSKGKLWLVLCLALLTACSSSPDASAPSDAARANQPAATAAAPPKEDKIEFPAGTKPEDQLKAIYAKLDVSLKNLDSKPLVAYLSQDYEVTAKDGQKLKGEAAIAAVQGAYQGVTEVTEYQTTISKIEQIEGTYVVFNTVTAKGKMPLRGAQAPFATSITSEDHWTRNNQGQWQVIASIERKNQLTIDGKVQK